MTDENQKGMEEKNEGKKKKPLLKWGILADIQGMDGKIALRNELIRRINQILTNEKIRNLYFTEFVVR
jgi:flagellar FliL protein